MVTISGVQKLEDYQVKELEDKQLFINIYDLDLKYIYEMNANWKEFFFDLLEEWSKKDRLSFGGWNESLFDFLKKNYNNIIKENHLKIDIRDYINLTDYISLEAWEQLSGNFLIKTDNGFYLVTLA